MSCFDCGKPVRCMGGLAEHLHDAHGWQTQMQCADCGVALTHRTARVHYRIHHPRAIPRLLCSCGDRVPIILNQKDNIGRHMEQVHGVRRVPSGFELVQPLRAPVPVSAINVPAIDLGGGQCSVCERVYNQEYLQRAHFIGKKQYCAMTVVDAVSSDPYEAAKSADQLDAVLVTDHE